MCVCVCVCVCGSETRAIPDLEGKVLALLAQVRRPADRDRRRDVDVTRDVTGEVTKTASQSAAVLSLSLSRVRGPEGRDRRCDR